jgi:hypothetical protein
MRVPLYPLLWLAVLSLVVSAVVHLYALRGDPPPLGRYTLLLHLGVFVVFLPAFLVARRLVREAGAAYNPRATLPPQCPRWMTWLIYGLVAYAMATFFWVVTTDQWGPRRVDPDSLRPGMVRGFSGLWLAFYWWAAAVLATAARAGAAPAPRCPNGHPVPPAAASCATCGSALARDER